MHCPLLEFPKASQVVEELTPRTVLHNEVQMSLGLEGVIEFHKEGMLCFGHNVSLLPSRALSLLFDDVTFRNNFHGVQLSGVYLFNKVYCAEASFSNLVDYLEVREL